MFFIKFVTFQIQVLWGVRVGVGFIMSLYCRIGECIQHMDKVFQGWIFSSNVIIISYDRASIFESRVSLFAT